MKIIIFGGGTGKRFWPLSRKQSPKQFMSVIDEKPLISLKYSYLRLGFVPSDMYVSTGNEYRTEIQKLLPQIPEENFIFEPQMRDNGAAVLYATMYVTRNNPNEVVSIQWSDHYIKRPSVFVHALHEAEKLVLADGKSVVIGVPARFPSPHRGYIKYGEKIKSLDENNQITLNKFVQFVEKPTSEVAEEYVKSGDYAWNPAYLVTTGTAIIEKYRIHAPHMYTVIKEIADHNFSIESQETYLSVEKIGFDYIFSENLSPSEAYVINADMGWSDVGEWVALKETLEKSPQDTVVSGNVVDMGSRNTIIYNMDDTKLVSTINLKDMVVVNTKDVVAIFKKDDNGKLKEYLKLLEEQNLSQYL